MNFLECLLQNSKTRVRSSFFIFLVTTTFLTTAGNEANAQIVLKGRVITSTKEAIPFVRIGIVETGVALMSGVDGSFQLQIPEQHKNRLLTFQVPGFKTSSFAIDSLVKEADLLVELAEDITFLNDFVVSNKKVKTKVIGNDGVRKGSDVDKDFEADINMAYAIKVKGKKTPFTVTKLWVLVRNPYSYPYYIRPLVMAYDEEGRKPGKSLIGENIYFEVQEGKGWIELDLEGYNINAEGTIVIGVEWLGTSSEIPYFSISYDFGNAESFRRTMTSEGFKATGKSNWLPYNGQKKRPLIKAEIQY